MVLHDCCTGIFSGITWLITCSSKWQRMERKTCLHLIVCYIAVIMLCLGCEGSTVIFPAYFLNLEACKSWREAGRLQWWVGCHQHSGIRRIHANVWEHQESLFRGRRREGSLSDFVAQIYSMSPGGSNPSGTIQIEKACRNTQFIEGGEEDMYCFKERTRDLIYWTWLHYIWWLFHELPWEQIEFFIFPQSQPGELRGSQGSVCPAASNTTGLHLYGLYMYNNYFYICSIHNSLCCIF